jgi:hypothetical protein
VTWQDGLLVLVLLMTLCNALMNFGLWLRHEAKRDRLESMDRRIVKLEERVGGMGDAISEVSDLKEDIAALNERSESTLSMVQSIQKFLMESGK